MCRYSVHMRSRATCACTARPLGRCCSSCVAHVHARQDLWASAGRVLELGDAPMARRRRSHPVELIDDQLGVLRLLPTSFARRPLLRRHAARPSKTHRRSSEVGANPSEVELGRGTPRRGKLRRVRLGEVSLRGGRKRGGQYTAGARAQVGTCLCLSTYASPSRGGLTLSIRTRRRWTSSNLVKMTAR